MLNETKWFTTKEAAEQLGCQPVTVRKAIDKGQLNAQKRGRDWVVYVDEKFVQFTLKPGRRGQRKHEGNGALADYQRRLRQALALAEELDPIIEAGTLGPVDATEELHALRKERGRELNDRQ